MASGIEAAPQDPKEVFSPSYKSPVALQGGWRAFTWVLSRQHSRPYKPSFGSSGGQPRVKPVPDLAFRRGLQRLDLCGCGSLSRAGEFEVDSALGGDRCGVCGRRRAPSLVHLDVSRCGCIGICTLSHTSKFKAAKILTDSRMHQTSEV